MVIIIITIIIIVILERHYDTTTTSAKVFKNQNQTERKKINKNRHAAKNTKRKQKHTDPRIVLGAGDLNDSYGGERGDGQQRDDCGAHRPVGNSNTRAMSTLSTTVVWCCCGHVHVRTRDGRRLTTMTITITTTTTVVDGRERERYAAGPRTASVSERRQWQRQQCESGGDRTRGGGGYVTRGRDEADHGRPGSAAQVLYTRRRPAARLLLRKRAIVRRCGHRRRRRRRGVSPGQP